MVLSANSYYSLSNRYFAHECFVACISLKQNDFKKTLPVLLN